MSRKATIATVSALLLGLGTISTGFAGAAPQDPFFGVWEAVDHDGSDMRLSFGGGGSTRLVTFRDDNATGGICESGGGWFMARGTGVIDGGQLEQTGRISGVWESGDMRCEDRTDLSETDDIEFEFRHDPLKDTLTDNSGVNWFRP